MKLAAIIVAILLALGAGGYFGWSEYQKEQEARARYADTVAKLELLVADVYIPHDRSPDATSKLAEYGCKPEWSAAPRSFAARFAEAEKLATTDPDVLPRLRADDSPRASYVLAMLLLSTPLDKRPELAGADPEALLRRASGLGHGHASYYFLRLLAEKYPHTQAPESSDDVATFDDINKRLEQAADAGSGAAAFLLGFRTEAEALWNSESLEKGRGRRVVAMTSRTPREWWCRSAQLGYAPGQLQCYQVGKRRSDEARKLLTAAADSGHAGASATLAELHATGQGGFAEDGAKQKEYLCRAIAYGDKRSIAALGRFEKAQALAARLQEAREARSGKAARRVAKKAAASTKMSQSKAKSQRAAKPKGKTPTKAKLAH